MATPVACEWAGAVFEVTWSFGQFLVKATEGISGLDDYQSQSASSPPLHWPVNCACIYASARLCICTFTRACICTLGRACICTLIHKCISSFLVEDTRLYTLLWRSVGHIFELQAVFLLMLLPCIRPFLCPHLHPSHACVRTLDQECIPITV